MGPFPTAVGSAARLRNRRRHGCRRLSRRAERLTCSWLPASTAPPPPPPPPRADPFAPKPAWQQGPPLTYLDRQLKRHSNCYKKLFQVEMTQNFIFCKTSLRIFNGNLKLLKTRNHWTLVTGPHNYGILNSTTSPLSPTLFISS